ncbi:MAG: hypothetical protein K0S74_240 [Chlamydiales bacterium]|jgi:hypothetical protein|nr:hypothetical protein [Chlamydiales bacterium]
MVNMSKISNPTTLSNSTDLLLPSENSLVNQGNFNKVEPTEIAELRLDQRISHKARTCFIPSMVVCAFSLVGALYIYNEVYQCKANEETDSDKYCKNITKSFYIAVLPLCGAALGWSISSIFYNASELSCCPGSKYKQEEKEAKENLYQSV